MNCLAALCLLGAVASAGGLKLWRYEPMIQIKISRRMAEELLQWIEDEEANWPPGTAYRDELAVLHDEIATQQIKEQPEMPEA